MLQRQDDIVAAYVAGSVARGQATALSDIDLVVLIIGEVDVSLGCDNIDGWLVSWPVMGNGPWRIIPKHWICWRTWGIGVG